MPLPPAVFNRDQLSDGIGVVRGADGRFVRELGDLVLPAQLAATEIFWYFVVLVWPALYWTVYL